MPCGFSASNGNRIRTMKDALTAKDVARPVTRARHRAPEWQPAMIRVLADHALTTAKFAEIGKLATGIIHEINNPIACLRSNLMVLLGSVPALAELALKQDGEARASGTEFGGKDQQPKLLACDLGELLEDIAAGIETITLITRNLKSLACSAHDEPKEADLHECIEAALRVAQHELKFRVRVEKEFGDIPKLMAYPGLLIQVFLNLFINAARAIDGEGVLRIRTFRQGPNVFIDVSDTGRGIVAERLGKIFRPSFTTNSDDNGLELGLGICKEIIGRHGGQIGVSGSPGNGTTFKIKLPLEAEALRSGAVVSGPRTNAGAAFMRVRFGTQFAR